MGQILSTPGWSVRDEVTCATRKFYQRVRAEKIQRDASLSSSSSSTGVVSLSSGLSGRDLAMVQVCDGCDGCRGGDEGVLSGGGGDLSLRVGGLGGPSRYWMGVGSLAERCVEVIAAEIVEHCRRDARGSDDVLASSKAPKGKTCGLEVEHHGENRKATTPRTRNPAGRSGFDLSMLPPELVQLVVDVVVGMGGHAVLCR